jgi:predicted Zn-dependent protease
MQLAINFPTAEVYSTFASVRISQQRPDEARFLLEKSMDAWYTEQDPIVIQPHWPLYASRLNLARLLIELELHDRACAVLETCMAENDEDAEGWYLFGWCYYQILQSPATDETENASVAADSLECLERVLNVFDV